MKLFEPILAVALTAQAQDGPGGPGGDNSRALKFKESDGYIVIEKESNCWDECGKRKGWSGKCKYCNMSNGTPGFCCNPRGTGSCTDSMVKAIRSSSIRSKNQYNCVIPKEFDDDREVFVRVLDRKDCWSQCGRKPGWAGKCNYCGGEGYCCHADGRGNCPALFSSTLKSRGIRGMRCVVPTGKKTDMRLDTVPSSACKDKRKSACRTLGQFKNASFEERLDCTRFFSANTCAALDRVNDSILAKQPPVCITRVVNSCYSEESEDGHRALVDTSGLDFTQGDLASWNVYTRELYEFILPFWQAGDADATDDDTDATDLQALLDSTNHVPDTADPPGSSHDRALAFIAELEAAAVTQFTDSDIRTGAFDDALNSPSVDAFSMIVALIDGLVIADMSLTLTTDVVPIDFDYENADIYSMSADNMDDLTSGSHHNGQPFRDNYRAHIADVADFDNMATLAWNLFSSSDSPCSSLLTPAELDAAVLSIAGITQNSVLEGSVMRDILADMQLNMQTHDLMETDSSQAFFNAMYQDAACVHATRNVAAVMEVSNTLTDQQTVSDTLAAATMAIDTDFALNGMTDENIMAAVEHVFPGALLYTSANAGDFDQNPTTDMNHQIALKAAELAGGTSDEQVAIATGMSDTTGTSYAVSMDRAIEQLGENAASKQIYQQIVTEFFESATAGNLGDLSAAVDPSFEFDLAGCIESMKSPSFGSPAEEVRCDLVGCMLQAGNTAHVEQLNALFDTSNMIGLNAVLTMVSSIDADSTIDDSVVNNLFNCEAGCDFTGIVWDKTRAAEDAACANTGVATGSGDGSAEGSGTVRGVRGIMAGVGIITAGTGVHGANGPMVEHLEQTLAWWQTTAEPTTTTIRPTKAPRPNKFLVRDGQAIDEAFYDSLWTTATTAVSGDVPATSNWCAVNACLACEGGTKAKVVPEQQDDGTELSTCVCPASLGVSDTNVVPGNATIPAPVAYGQFVMDFIDNFPHANLTAHERQCVGESLAGLMTPTRPALDSIMRHIFADIQEKDDLATLTNVQNVLASNEFRFNGGMVIETLISTQNALDDKATVAGTAPDYSGMNAWDFTSGAVDWTVSDNEDATLSLAYLTQILGGYDGANTIPADCQAAVEGDYDMIFNFAAGKQLNCLQQANCQTTHWVCPDGVPLATASVANGCTSTDAVEVCCVSEAWQTSAWSWNSPMNGMWGAQYFGDMMSYYGASASGPVVGSAEACAINAGVAAAMAAAGGAGGRGLNNAGDVAAAINDWFGANSDAATAATVAEILSNAVAAGQDDALTWLMNGGNQMQGGLGGWGNGASDAWMELSSLSNGVANGGSWLGFGSHNGSETSEYDGFSKQDYMNMMNGLDGSVMGQSWMDQWATNAAYEGFYKGINGPFPPSVPGDPQPPATLATITFVSIEWPVEPQCVIDVTSREAKEWFEANGKSTDDMTTITSVLDGQTDPFNCESVDGQLQTLFNQAGHIDVIQDCIDSSAWAGLIGLLEIISYTGKKMTPGSDDDFKAMDWSWIPDGTTDAELTPEFITNGIEGMPNMPDMPNIGTDIRDVLDTNAGVTSGDSSADSSADASGDTGSTDDGSGDSNSNGVEDGANPYAPATDTSSSSSSGYDTSSSSSSSSYDSSSSSSSSSSYDSSGTSSSSSSYDSSGTSTGTSTGYDGTGSMAGDPHVHVSSASQPTVCFDISDVHLSILNLIADSNTGLRVNGQLFQEGKHTRLERVYIESPSGVMITITTAGVKIEDEHGLVQLFNYQQGDEIFVTDTYIQTVSNNEFSKKNGAYITLPGANGYEIKFHVSIKNGKESMRFEIIDAKGLSTNNLGGIIGESIIPSEYEVDQDGNIHIESRLVPAYETAWDASNNCIVLATDSAITTFMGHRISSYRVKKPFDTITMTVHEDISPK